MPKASVSTPSPESVPRPQQTRGRVRVPPAVLPPLATVALTLIALVPVLRLWDADFATPFTGYSSDANLNIALVKGLLEHGWYQENPTVGVPFGLELYDFPVFSGDNLFFVELALLGLFVSDAVVALNLFVVLSFPLTALAALFALRRLGVAAALAVVCAVLFAFLPYHFTRTYGGHIFLAAYWTAPLAVWLVLALLGGQRLFARSAEKRRLLAYATGTSLVTLAACVVIGSSGLYYAFFSLVLVSIAGLSAALAGRSRRPLVTAGILVGAIVFVVALNLAPNVVHRITDGSNAAVGGRGPAESETFALKLTHLILPVQDHRIDRLAAARTRYDSSAPPPADYGVALGSVATVGLAALLFALLAAPLGWRGPPPLGERLRQASVPALATLLTITVGGLGSVFAYAVSPQIRGWYRLSIFLGFLALLAVGLLLTEAGRRLGPSRGGRAVFAAALGVVLVGGLLDQTTDSFVPRYEYAKAEYQSERAFVRAIERRLPPGSDVFQLPYIAFPETVVERADAYDGARGYIHSRRLRWSWGSMKGRPEDWPAELADEPVEVAAAAAAASGFEGLWLDRFALPDSGADAERRLGALIGGPPLTSSNGRLSFYDLRRLARCEETRFGPDAVKALAVATLRPITVVWGPGFSYLESGSSGFGRWADRRAELIFRNPSADPRRVVLSTGLHTGVAGRFAITITYPDGRRDRIPVSSESRLIRRTFAVGPGTSIVRFQTDAPRVASATDRRVHMSFDSPEVREDAIDDAERGFGICAATQ